ncbi:hypothetical protein CF66_3006 [Candidatus Photodesmus katoptron]|uniref:endonuclease/exonuclease/phosphatase family protein n=1 Tax=Candidatus Photodesmus anomalopis TaxID=28176 RepID=UPI0004D9F41A|nr:endonuclease/exonuclease/phosphatase family protein [Candidatus Photodesmus katoptron]KEY90286.1 hypothetical protein CF66_3006 [Candidatus Photodesmus katoptron]
MFIFITPPTSRVAVENCSKTVNIIQFNMFYKNQDINDFINYLISNPVDLVVLQEVGLKQREELILLSDIYPFQYGTEPSIRIPVVSQMILSKSPLLDMSFFHTHDGWDIVNGLWHSSSEEIIRFFSVHLPSPRTKSLWSRRNMLLSTMEYIVNQYQLDDILIVGDFNLSSNSARFYSLFSKFQTEPVVTWPNWNFLLAWPIMPYFSMISIDHLWFKSANTDWQICSRSSKESISLKSDHRMVLTKIGH